MNAINDSLISNFINNITRHGLVVFAGAGVSADDPSNVPGWYSLNSMIIEALKQRVTSYLGRDPIWLDQVIHGVIDRRDKKRFPPEYQAQIMEEQCGESYFNGLTAVDILQHNQSHMAIAELARGGYLKAIVTTNFDCLIENTLDNEHILHEVFIDDDDFHRLSEKRNSSFSSQKSIPVIKIHGSAKKALSMIDTLKQRLLGRSELLSNILQDLLSHHNVLYIGFSAADLNHDPEYLGICRSAKSSPGALFVQYPGSILEPGANSLIMAYGQKIVLTEAKLKDIFLNILTSLKLNIPKRPLKVDDDTRGTIAARLETWAHSLQPYEAINVLTALLDAGGEEDAAFNILNHTWKSRLSPDSDGDHYARFQYNYSNHCMQSGEMLYEETPNNFWRSKDKIPKSNIGFAHWSLYMGKVENFWPLVLQVKNKTFQQSDPGFIGDETLVYAHAAVIYHWIENLNDILEAAKFQIEAGELHRALKLRTAAARLAALSGDLGIVNELYNQSEPFFRYLGDDLIEAEFYLAFAIAQRKRRSASTGGSLASAISILRRYQYWPLWIEALIEGIYYYVSENKIEDAILTVNEVSQRLEKGYNIYYPALGIAVAEYHFEVKQWDRAKRELIRVLPFAEQYKNEWAISSIEGLLKQVDEMKDST
jgi:hypothetical protein